MPSESLSHRYGGPLGLGLMVVGLILIIVAFFVSGGTRPVLAGIGVAALLASMLVRRRLRS
jgi:hypothetical protein